MYCHSKRKRIVLDSGKLVRVKGDPGLLQDSTELTGIPWSSFREDEIIYLLMKHFALLRFSTHSPHFADPSHEGGVDLEAKSRRERIVVAVKKHPKGPDRAQLTDLSRIKASKRIYVYISSPTESFRKEMNRTKNVQFWDSKELSLQLVESGVSFGLMLDNSVLMSIMKQIFTQFIAWGSASKSPKAPEITPQNLGLLWSIKDKSVELHKGSRLAQMLLERGYERRKEGKNVNLKEELLDMCSTALSLLNRDAAVPILRLIQTAPDTLKFGAHASYNGGHVRSDWKGILSFVYERKASVPGNLIREEKPSDRMAPLVFPGEPISALRMHDASSAFRVLANYASDLEGVINGIFERVVGLPLGALERAFGSSPSL